MAKKVLKNINTKVNNKRFIRLCWILLFSPVIILFTIIILTALGAFGPLPGFEDLENPKSNLATEVYSEDGVLIGSFYIQNRSYTAYEELSPNLVAALVATEDSRFYSHSGIDFMGLARVAVRTVALRQKQGGGSTITQQLAKNLYDTRDTISHNNSMNKYSNLFISKLKEWITAVRLEYNYTKEEIIAMYLNTVAYGSNAYGIKSASRTFFNKAPDELTIEEAAVLVGVVNAPTRYSPIRNPKNAEARRNTVIARMETQGFITRAERDSLQAVPIKLDFTPISHNTGTGTYFREMLRLVMTAEKPKASSYANNWDYEQAIEMWENDPLYGWCHKNLKSDGTQYNLYRDGLKIYTTINSVMQRYAEEAVREHLAGELQPRMDKQVADTKRLFHRVTDEQVDNILRNAMQQTDRFRALKREKLTDEEIFANFERPTEMRIFTYDGERDTVMSPKDSILHHKRYLRASLMAMDPNTGFVKAYVGGPDFRYFKYDMVRQGKRQVGSTIKPFIYTFAVDHLGLSPYTTVYDYPVSIETYNGEAWSPKEASAVGYDGSPHPLWWGLANSRNNYSAWIMKQAKQPEAVASFIHKMGIKGHIDPVPALCLGTPDVSVYEMVAAYSTYVNRGVHTEPLCVTRIEDRHGNVLSTFTAQTSDAISEQTAYTMLDMLQKVVTSGTGGRVGWMYGMRNEIGGKTGTSQNNSDAWFIGVTPNLAAGTWVGGEDRSVHFLSGADGARVALPIFAYFMQKVYDNPSLGVSKEDKFFVPAGGVPTHYTSNGGERVIEADIYGDDEFF